MPVVDGTGIGIGFQPMPDTDKVKINFTGFKNNGKNDEGEFKVTLELTVDEGEHTGHKLFMNHTLGEKGLPYWKESMVMLGAKPADLEGTLDTDAIAQGLISNSGYVSVTTREHQGRKFNNVRWISTDSWS